MLSLSPEIIALFVIAIGINLAFVYWYVTKRISILRFERINEFLTIKGHEFQQRFNEGLKEFREASLNLQHDFKRFDRLRAGIDNSFTIIENKIAEIDTHSQNLAKTSNFYQELKDSLIANNSQLQTMFAKLKNLESDIGTKEEVLQELSSGVKQLKSEFDEKLSEARQEIQSGFTQIENLSKVNSNKIKADYEDVLADFKDRIDIFMNEEKEHIASEVEVIQSEAKTNIENLQAEVSNEDERLKTLKERYEHWEQDFADFQEKNQNRVHEISEKILTSFKEKIDDYQNEIIVLLEKNQNKLMAQTEDIVKRNEDKQALLDDLSNFVEQAKSTVTHEIDNLAEFLAQQKQDRIDAFISEARAQLAGEIESVIQSEIKASIENLQTEVSNEDERLNTLKERYQYWEQDLVDFQEKNQAHIHEFSENTLTGFKEKVANYQNEVIALLEKKQGELLAQTEALVKYNEDKRVLVDDLTDFVERAKSTVTYQIDNLADFLEQQKKDRIDIFMNEARAQLAEEIKTIQYDMKASIENLHNEVSNEDERLQTFKERYEQWEKDLADSQEKHQNRVHEFSEKILTGFKEKTNDYQNKTMALLENKRGELIVQTEDIIKHNEDKQRVIMNDLSDFVEQAKSTVTHQVDELAEFLAHQKQDRIDTFINEAKEQLAGEVETIQSGIKASIEDLKIEISDEDGRLKTFKEHYEHWEKDLADFQEKHQNRVHEFSEKILTDFKEKVASYQNEVIALLEKKQGELLAQTEGIVKNNKDKQVMLDDLINFVEQAKSTVTYQIDNLANFLEQQKKKQAELYQKNQVVLVDTFTKIKTEFADFRTDMDEARKTKKKIFAEIDDYIDVRMKDTMESEAPQVLEKIFEVDLRDPSSKTSSKATRKSKGGGGKDFLHKFTELVDAKAKESVAGHTSEVLAKLEKQEEWKKFLEQQTADTLLKKLKVDNIFSRIKGNLSKEFLRKELSEEIKNYRKQVGDIVKDWSKFSSEVNEQKNFFDGIVVQGEGKAEELLKTMKLNLAEKQQELQELLNKQKKFLDQLLVQGEDKVEELLGTMKLNLAEKQQELQDLFNQKILDMEAKMSTVSSQIDVFLARSKSVEKVFALQKEFSESMAFYNQQLKNLKVTSGRFEDFNKKFAQFEQDTKRLEGMHKGVVEKQEVLESLQKQLDTVMSMTGEIEENFATARKHSQEVNDFLDKVQTHSEEVDKIKNAISTVREIEKDSKTVKEWVNEIKIQAEQNLNKAEQFLGKVSVGEELQKKITQQLKSIEDQSLLLDEKYQNLQSFNKKFDEFDMAVFDVEQRIKVIDELKKEMAVEQENLSKLKENFNEQISILLKVINNQKDGDPKLFSELDKQFKSLPATLSALGWSDKEIAKHLNMELFEVQVLLNNKKRKR